MKFISCALIFTLIESSFSQGYYPVLNQNKSWDVLGSTYGQTGLCGYGFGDRYEITGDTLFNGKQYQILRSHHFQTSDGNLFFCPPYIVSTAFSNSYPDFYLREDTFERRLFIYAPNEDELLFDFSWQVGDTVISNPALPIITKIDTISLLNGDQRRRFFISLEGITVPYAIEGIGFTCGFRSFTFFCECHYTLICVKQNNESLYSDSIYVSQYGASCFFYSNIQEIQNDNSISISPNPTDGNLSIHKTQNSSKQSVQIFNYTGKLIFEDSNFIGETIDTRQLNNGIYLLKYSDGKSYSIKKFVVQH